MKTAEKTLQLHNIPINHKNYRKLVLMGKRYIILH